MKKLALLLVGFSLLGLGCDTTVRVGPSLAEAANLPLETAPELGFSPTVHPPAPFEWGLYKTVFCAEKTGAALQIEGLLQAAGHTPESWKKEVDKNFSSLSESGAAIQEKWRGMALTPCP